MYHDEGRYYCIVSTAHASGIRCPPPSHQCSLKYTVLNLEFPVSMTVALLARHKAQSQRMNCWCHGCIYSTPSRTVIPRPQHFRLTEQHHHDAAFREPGCSIYSLFESASANQLSPVVRSHLRIWVSMFLIWKRALAWGDARGFTSLPHPRGVIINYYPSPVRIVILTAMPIIPPSNYLVS